ncbi:MAG: copper chaperone PCu(A)C [Balneolaceae bacterium]|nr:copper chaperone PCu(A)C [Balneolaceae bacterium]
MRVQPVFLALAVFVSCSSEKAQEIAEPKEDRSARKKVEELVRPGVKGGNSGAYFRLTNTLEKADTVLSINTAAAAMAEAHEMYENEEGMAAMRHKPNLIIPAGEALIFKPGGLHVMLMDLQRNLQQGDTVRLHIKLAQRGDVMKPIPVEIDN